MFNTLSVVCIIPALNEAQSIGIVIDQLKTLLDDKRLALIDRIIVCDNGSTDNTAAIAQHAGAEVVREPLAGYGRACLKAIAAVEACDILLFVDGDDSCYPEQATALFEALDKGADLCIGSRIMGSIEKGALTPAQRLGNRLATALIGLIWQEPATDLGPFRAIRWQAFKQLAMQDKTFGWTVEMQVKAIQQGLKTVEVSVDSKVRTGQSKISGTVKGTLLAGIGILSKIAVLWWQGLRDSHRLKKVRSEP